MKKEDRLAKKEREDQALNRVLWWFGGAVVLEFILLLLNRSLFNYNDRNFAVAPAILTTLRVLTWICLAAGVALGVLWWMRKRAGKKTFLFGACALASAILFVCFFVAGTWPKDGVPVLSAGVPVVAVLALIYYLYQREFFLVALQGGVTMVAMWAYSKMIYINAALVYGVLIAAGVVAVAAAVLYAILQRGKGKLGKVRVLPKRCNYIPLYLSCAITLLAVVLANLGIRVAYGALLGVVVWLFGAAVYYTVRLM